MMSYAVVMVGAPDTADGKPGVMAKGAFALGFCVYDENDCHHSKFCLFKKRKTVRDDEYGITWNGTLLVNTPVGVVSVENADPDEVRHGEFFSIAPVGLDLKTPLQLRPDYVILRYTSLHRTDMTRKITPALTPQLLSQFCAKAGCFNVGVETRLCRGTWLYAAFISPTLTPGAFLVLERDLPELATS